MYLTAISHSKNDTNKLNFQKIIEMKASLSHEWSGVDQMLKWTIKSHEYSNRSRCHRRITTIVMAMETNQRTKCVPISASHSQRSWTIWYYARNWIQHKDKHKMYSIDWLNGWHGFMCRRKVTRPSNVWLQPSLNWTMSINVSIRQS